jgi:glycosyltransferase involved in cell wall biosynthesis
MRPLIYLPAYNCSKTIVSTIQEIPESVAQLSQLLVVDNCSPDGTAAMAADFLKTSSWRGRATVLRTTRNLGYAGSQKLAFRLARSQADVPFVVMLHADGQYPPRFMPDFFSKLESGSDLAYGRRSKETFGDLEETPFKVKLAITTLNKLECLLTGCPKVREWHSGYVGYSTAFLKRLNLSAITETRHIDGNMLFAATKLGARIDSVPIFKRYKDFEGFHGPAAYAYILHCLGLMLKMPGTVGALRQPDSLAQADPRDFEAELQP